MSKKYYSAPSIEVFDFSTEQIIAVSIGKGDGEIDNPDDILTNKRQPASSPWNSSNWSTKE